MQKEQYFAGEDERGNHIYNTYYVYHSPVYVHFGQGASCTPKFMRERNSKYEHERLHEESEPLYRDERGQYVHQCRYCACWHVSDVLPEGAFSVILREDDEWFKDDGIPF